MSQLDALATAGLEVGMKMSVGAECRVQVNQAAMAKKPSDANRGLSLNEMSAGQSRLAALSDRELLQSAKTAVNKERSALFEVLQHLIVIEDRKIFALNHSSLFSYVTEEMAYSESSAQRRISAARLLRVCPEVGPAVVAGRLNLCNLSQAATFFRMEKKRGEAVTLERKLEVLRHLDGKSARAGLQYLLSLSPEHEKLKAKRKSSMRPVGGGMTAVTFYAEENRMKKLKKVQSLMAHTVRNGDFGDVVERMADIVIEKLDPFEKAKRARARKEKQKKQADEKKQSRTSDRMTTVSFFSSIEVDPVTGETQECFPMDELLERSRYVEADVRNEVYLRDSNGCTWMNEKGERCGSFHGLELDHDPIPFALGGANTADNLTLRCYVHNSLGAAQTFGHRMIAWKIEEAKQKRAGRPPQL
jgi:hypothetical protein